MGSQILLCLSFTVLCLLLCCNSEAIQVDPLTITLPDRAILSDKGLYQIQSVAQIPQEFSLQLNTSQFAEFYVYAVAYIARETDPAYNSSNLPPTVLGMNTSSDGQSISQPLLNSNISSDVQPYNYIRLQQYRMLKDDSKRAFRFQPLKSTSDLIESGLQLRVGLLSNQTTPSSGRFYIEFAVKIEDNCGVIRIDPCIPNYLNDPLVYYFQAALVRSNSQVDITTNISVQAAPYDLLGNALMNLSPFESDYSTPLVSWDVFWPQASNDIFGASQGQSCPQLSAEDSSLPQSERPSSYSYTVVGGVIASQQAIYNFAIRRRQTLAALNTSQITQQQSRQFGQSIQDRCRPVQIVVYNGNLFKNGSDSVKCSQMLKIISPSQCQPQLQQWQIIAIAVGAALFVVIVLVIAGAILICRKRSFGKSGVNKLTRANKSIRVNDKKQQPPVKSKSSRVLQKDEQVEAGNQLTKKPTKIARKKSGGALLQKSQKSLADPTEIVKHNPNAPAIGPNVEENVVPTKPLLRSAVDGPIASYDGQNRVDVRPGDATSAVLQDVMRDFYQSQSVGEVVLQQQQQQQQQQHQPHESAGAQQYSQQVHEDQPRQYAQHLAEEPCIITSSDWADATTIEQAGIVAYIDAPTPGRPVVVKPPFSGVNRETVIETAELIQPVQQLNVVNEDQEWS
ncbi:hypothetical protein MIR68_004431 [Amoeboaphelidium protococcarum]|nr:hypothetical protein MIR68_004431 [Amoeboaphelidium protococcarum]